MTTPKPRLSHVTATGEAHMVDTSLKQPTRRVATAQAELHLTAEALQLITEGTTPKGDVLAVARIAGIAAAKQTYALIPLCHQIPLSSVNITFITEPQQRSITTTATAKAFWSTGVEMEALTAVSIACLTIYDMIKAVDKAATIKNLKLIKKSGGKSGEFTNP